MKDDLFIDELTEERKPALRAACEAGAGFLYRRVRFQKDESDIVSCATQYWGDEVSLEIMAAAIEHAKLVRAELARAVPELGWDRPDSQATYEVIRDWDLSAMALAEERAGKIVMLTGPDAVH